VKRKNDVLLKRQGCDLLNPPCLIQLLSNQQREPGKKSRPGGAAESEQLPPACIASYVKRLYKNGYFFSFLYIKKYFFLLPAFS